MWITRQVFGKSPAFILSNMASFSTDTEAQLFIPLLPEKLTAFSAPERRELAHSFPKPYLSG